MEYRKLGRSGLDVSLISIGSSTFGASRDRKDSIELLATAKDLGVNTIDTANVHHEGRAEEVIGNAIHANRHEWVVMTKFALPMDLVDQGAAVRPDASRRQIIMAVEGSLRRLNTAYIDVLQMHWPDPTTPIEETMSTLHQLVVDGKVCYLGCSNFAGWEVARANALARQFGWSPFASLQVRYNLLDRRPEREQIPSCQYFGAGLLPWGALANGFLTGKYRRNQPPPPGTRLAEGHESKPFGGRSVLSARNFDRLEALETIAAARGMSMTDLAMAWLAGRSAVSSVIVGVRTIEQLHKNVAALDTELTPEDLSQIDEITR